MKQNYKDITSRINEEPKWYDDNGVPRYDEFSPCSSPNVYADEVCLFEVACQSCKKFFTVSKSSDRFESLQRGRTLRELILSKNLWYKDPPNVGCCPAGPTMTSNTVRIHEYWSHGFGGKWSRDSTVESSDVADEVLDEGFDSIEFI